MEIFRLKRWNEALHERHVTTGLTSFRGAMKMAIKETSWLSDLLELSEGVQQIQEQRSSISCHLPVFSKMPLQKVFKGMKQPSHKSNVTALINNWLGGREVKCWSGEGPLGNFHFGLLRLTFGKTEWGTEEVFY